MRIIKYQSELYNRPAVGQAKISRISRANEKALAIAPGTESPSDTSRVGMLVSCLKEIKRKSKKGKTIDIHLTASTMPKQYHTLGIFLVY